MLSPNKIINVWINKLFVYKIMIKAVCTNNYLLIRTNLLEVTFLSPQEWIKGKKTRQKRTKYSLPVVYSESLYINFIMLPVYHCPHVWVTSSVRICVVDVSVVVVIQFIVPNVTTPHILTYCEPLICISCTKNNFTIAIFNFVMLDRRYTSFAKKSIIQNFTTFHLLTH